MPDRFLHVDQDGCFLIEPVSAPKQVRQSMPERMLKAYGVPIGREFGRIAALLLLTMPEGVMVARAKALGVLVFDEKRPLPLGRFDVINVACCYCLSLGRTRSTPWLLGKPVPSDRLPGRRLVPTAP
jgi:hypothetical protein